MIDVALALAGGPLHRDYAAPLQAALCRLLPWFDAEPEAAVHPLRGVTQVDGRVYVGAHSRLVLRVPEPRADACLALEGSRLDVDQPLRLGRGRKRALLAHSTLYSPLVITGDEEEDRFLATVNATVAHWDARCQVIVGRGGTCATDTGGRAGFSVMLHGVTPAVSLRAQAEGVGSFRKYGCGVFVPHRSADAVVA